MNLLNLRWWWLPYLAAAVNVAAALLAQPALGPLLGGDASLLLLTLAVVLSANRGGFGPGLCATILGLCGLLWPVLGATGGLAAEPARLGLFSVIGVCVSWLAEQSRRADARRNEALAAHRRSLAEGAQAAEMLRERDTRLGFVLEAAELGEWELDLNTFVARRSPRYDWIFGYTSPAPRWSYDIFLDHVHPDDRARVDHDFRAAMETGTRWDCECRIVRADGEPRWIAACGRSWEDGPAAPRRMLGTVQDITARKLAEEALRESEVRFRAMADTAPMLIWMAGADGLCTFFNQSWLRFTGRTLERELGAGWNAGVWPDDRERRLARYASAFETRQPFETEYRLRGADGQYRWLIDKGIPRFGPSGEFLGYIGSCMDITARKAAEEMILQAQAELENRVIARTAELSAANQALEAEVRQRRLAEATLQEQQNFLQAVLEHIEDGIVACDAAGALTFFNRATRESHGLPAGPVSLEEWANHCELRRLDGETRLTPEEVPLFRALRDGRVENVEMVVAPRNGRPRTLRANGRAVSGPRGEKLGAVVSLHDVTLQREAEETLRRSHENLERRVAERTAALARANAKLEEEISERKQIEGERARLLESERQARGEAEQAGRVKDEFLATLSHELRTPLNSILGWAQLLQRNEKPSGELAQGLESIERGGRMQAQLIEELLDMSRIVSGKLRLELRLTALASLAAEAVETARPAAEVKGVALRATLDPAARFVQADGQRLQQVLGNLLTNALKFTPRGGQVEVRLVYRGSTAEISVRDTGQGIAPEFLPHVFDRFRQADASTTRKHGGLGLGLAIAKHLVALHGGTIDAQSAGEGRGSIFTLVLPTVVPAARTEEPALRQPVSSALSDRDPPLLTNMRILVVDDDLDACAIVRRLFEDRKAAVTTASSVAEAFELFQRERPDILVSDIGMPGQDGYDLIRRVRALEPPLGGATPAVALTAFARSEDRVRALNAGYHMHVTKPVEPRELIMVVASLVARRSDGSRCEKEAS